MSELLKRLRSETPKFWRSAQKRATAALLTIGAALSSEQMPEPLLPPLKYAGAFCVAVIVVAQFTCTDTPAPPSPTDTI